jgi:16S rRNA G1207 methylase RsmC
MNINTKQYWEERFGSGDWEKKGGFSQSTQLCLSQIPILEISKDFDGLLLDFGCGAGAIHRS